MFNTMEKENPNGLSQNVLCSNNIVIRTIYRSTLKAKFIKCGGNLTNSREEMPVEDFHFEYKRDRTKFTMIRVNLNRTVTWINLLRHLLNIYEVWNVCAMLLRYVKSFVWYRHLSYNVLFNKMFHSEFG